MVPVFKQTRNVTSFFRQINRFKYLAQIILRILERLINIILISGVFTAPRAGVYLITFSYYSYNGSGELTLAYLFTNGQRLDETEHNNYYTGDGSGRVQSTSGRAVYQKLEAGDTITLQTGAVTGYMGEIMLCVQFINN